MPEGVEEAIHKMAKKEAMTGELNFEDDYDTSYVPDPIDPLDLILNHAWNLEEVTESEVKDLKEDGHEDSDETGSIDSGGSIEELDPMEVYENITQDVSTDNQENSDKNGSRGNNDSTGGIRELIPIEENDNAIHESPDENGSLGNNDSVEEMLELISVKENDNAINESPQPTNSEPISENKNGKAAQENPRYNLRPHRERNYAHRFAQMNYRAGLKAFGSEAIEAIKKEMKQLHQYNCVTPRSDLSWKQKRGALVRGHL